MNLSIGALFRIVSYVSRNPDVALNLAGPITAMNLLFGGFLITSQKIPNFLIEFFWISPFSWGLRSNALNEFKSQRYDFLGAQGGDTYLNAWQISTNSGYKWGGIGYLLGLFCVLICLSATALKYKRSGITTGTRREHAEEGLTQDETGSFIEPFTDTTSAAAADAGNTDTAALVGAGQQQQCQRVAPAAPDVVLGMKTSSMLLARAAADALEASRELAFTRMDLSFTDLKYTVQVKGEDGKLKDRVLLNSVNGFAKAGELTALMGSSGAGKSQKFCNTRAHAQRAAGSEHAAVVDACSLLFFLSLACFPFLCPSLIATLMDVLAGRKTSGIVTGSILVNGHPQSFPAFNRLMGFAEQEDIHVGMHTVREAIEFSAALRLDRSVSKEARERFVEHILDELELVGIADRIIGDGNIEGLSPGELKRVTIGVELAANPTFLFLSVAFAFSFFIEQRACCFVVAHPQCQISSPAHSVFFFLCLCACAAWN